jgi:hypothetical protein
MIKGNLKIAVKGLSLRRATTEALLALVFFSSFGGRLVLSSAGPALKFSSDKIPLMWHNMARAGLLDLTASQSAGGDRRCWACIEPHHVLFCRCIARESKSAGAAAGPAAASVDAGAGRLVDRSAYSVLITLHVCSRCSVSASVTVFHVLLFPRNHAQRLCSRSWDWLPMWMATRAWAFPKPNQVH